MLYFSPLIPSGVIENLSICKTMPAEAEIALSFAFVRVTRYGFPS